MIKATWYEWNYGRADGESHWLEICTANLETKETPRSYVVRYGSGNLRKVLCKLTRLGRRSCSQWIEYYGSHERYSYSKIIFQVAQPEPAAIDYQI